MLIPAIFCTIFLAFMVSTVSGGGAGLVAEPLLCLIIPVTSVPAALSIGTAASSLSRIAIFRRSIRWDIVVRFVPAALPTALIGAWLLSFFDPVYVELIIGCFLVGNLPAMFRAKPKLSSAPSADLRHLYAVGAAAGLVSGFTGAVGLIFNNVYFRLGMTVSEIVATRAMNEILLHLAKIGVYAAFGLISTAVLQTGALIAVAAVLASFVMRPMLPMIREALFRRIAQAAMVSAGVAMLFLSGQKIADINGAWVAVTHHHASRELQIFWSRENVLSLEANMQGHIEFEKPISFAALSSDVQAAMTAIAPLADIRKIEKVWGTRGFLYELSYEKQGRLFYTSVFPNGD